MPNISDLQYAAFSKLYGSGLSIHDMWVKFLSEEGAVSVTAFGMVGGTDVTTALSAFWASAQTQGVALFIPKAANGLAYKVSSILSPWNGARITSNGATLDFQTDHSATGRGIHIGSAVSVTPVSDVRITGLNVISSNSTSRLGVYGLISIFNSSNVIIQDCYLGSSTAKYGGEAAGIFVMNSNTLTIRNVVVENTLADGIHISRGSYNVIIDNPIVINSQDDAIAVVSIKQDGAGPIYAACKDIQIRNPVVKSTTVLGSGIALQGAQRVTIVGGTVDSVVARGLTIGSYNQGGIFYPSLITVTGLIITNVGAAETAITVTSADRVTFHALNISSVFAGINVLGCTRTTISGCDISTTGAAQYGVYDNAGSSRTNVSGCNLSGSLGGAFLFQGTGSISTGANIVA